MVTLQITCPPVSMKVDPILLLKELPPPKPQEVKPTETP